MAVFKFDFLCAPVIHYNFEETAEGCGYNPQAMPALACGFFVSKLTQELIDHPDAKFEQEHKVKLADHIGGPVIWMEESSRDLYPEIEVRAILLHENAHIVHGDHESQVGFDVVQDNELRADAYAAERVGKKALARALKRTAFIIAERRWGKGEKATAKAKELIRCGEMAERLNALK